MRISEKVVSVQNRTVCDLCLVKQIETNSFYTCVMCGKDLCSSCITDQATNDGLSSSMRADYCKKCWNVGSTYREKIKELSTAINEQVKQWKKDAIECS